MSKVGLKIGGIKSMRVVDASKYKGSSLVSIYVIYSQQFQLQKYKALCDL